MTLEVEETKPFWYEANATGVYTFSIGKLDCLLDNKVMFPS